MQIPKSYKALWNQIKGFIPSNDIDNELDFGGIIIPISKYGSDPYYDFNEGVISYHILPNNNHKGYKEIGILTLIKVLMKDGKAVVLVVSMTLILRRKTIFWNMLVKRLVEEKCTTAMKREQHTSLSILQIQRK